MDADVEADLAKLYKVSAKKYTPTHISLMAKRIDDKNASVEGWVGMGNPESLDKVKFTYQIRLEVRMDPEGFRISKFEIPEELVIPELGR